MSNIALSDYFSGDEEIRFTHFRIPRLLITHPHFKSLSANSKLLYGMLLNRMSLSAKNGWHDNEGRVYIYYTVKEVCEAIGCGRNKAMRLFAELDANKGIGLIERVKQGQGKPDRIFVKRITGQEDTEVPNHAPAVSVSEDDLSDAQRTEKPASSSLENRPLEVSKANPSYIDKNQTEFIHTNQSIYPPTPSAKELGIDGCEVREEHIRRERSRQQCSAANAIPRADHTMPLLPFRCPAQFGGNTSHRETYFGLPSTTHRLRIPQEKTPTARPPTADSAAFAVLSGQVCHLLNTNDHLSGGAAPLKPPRKYVSR